MAGDCCALFFWRSATEKHLTPFQRKISVLKFPLLIAHGASFNRSRRKKERKVELLHAEATSVSANKFEGLIKEVVLQYCYVYN